MFRGCSEPKSFNPFDFKPLSGGGGVIQGLTNGINEGQSSRVNGKTGSNQSNHPYG